MARINLEVIGIEFEEDGNTIWVNGLKGTVLRIRCTGKIQITTCEAGAAPHADILVQGDIAFCLPNGSEEEVGYVH